MEIKLKTYQMKQIINSMLEQTNIKVCVSLVIPGDRQYPRLDREIDILLTYLRRNSNYMDRIFTANNNRLRKFMCKNVSTQGTQLILSNRGKKLLWLRLRDNIERSLTTGSVTENHTEGHRETYRREGSNNLIPRPRLRNNTRNDCF